MGRWPQIVMTVMVAAAVAALVVMLTRRGREVPPPTQPPAPASFASPPASGSSGSAVQGAQHAARRRILVLDLDETLVHSRPDLSSAAAGGGVGEGGRLEVLVRPGAQRFLADMAEAFDEVAIFTAGTREYADAVIDSALDPSRAWIQRRLYRESCEVDPPLAKDLRRLGVPLSDVLLVDNSPASFALQPRNGLLIESYWGDPADDALARLTPLLRRVAQRPDVDVRELISSSPASPASPA